MNNEQEQISTIAQKQNNYDYNRIRNSNLLNYKNNDSCKISFMSIVRRCEGILKYNCAKKFNLQIYYTQTQL